MRIKIVASFCLLGIPGAHALAEIAAPITAVVLYPGSATVVRTAQVQPGTTQVSIPGLPTHFDRQTLRAEAGPGIRIGEIVTQEAAMIQAVNPAEADLETRIQALKDQMAALDAEVKSAEIVTGYLENFGGNGTTENPRQSVAVDARTLAGIIDTLGRGAQDALAKKHRLEVQKRELGKRVDALQRDLTRLRTGAKDMRVVTVNLAAERAGVVKISYQVNNAGWKPAYRAGLNSTSSKVELERLATISQKTGEDWSNVKLTLSTSQPRLSPQGAEPQPWVLSYSPPRPASESRGMPLAYAAAPAPARAKAMMSADEEDAYRPPTFETNSTFATEFEVPTRVSLLADGRETSVVLAKQVLAVKQELRVAPRLDPAATVSAEADRPQGVWLAGNMQLFRDGSYVGSTQWNPKTSERFVFSFGRDELLRVAVNQVKGNSGTTGVFDRRNERRMADEFTVTSAHKTPVDVLVLESSPTSAADEVKVQANFDPKPSIEAWEQRRGVVAWKRTLAPSETAKFNMEYSIEYPKEGTVFGLR